VIAAVFYFMLFVITVLTVVGMSPIRKIGEWKCPRGNEA